ncbi:MAG: hypothetical protein WCF04_05895 [Candidatus Nanopelagicales bacterium]
MSDPYWEISRLAMDNAMVARVIACAAQEGIPDPENWVFAHRWQWAASLGWGAAWAYALATGVAELGQNPAVITDLQILAAVQAIRAQGV